MSDRGLVFPGSTSLSHFLGWDLSRPPRGRAPVTHSKQTLGSKQTSPLCLTTLALTTCYACTGQQAFNTYLLLPGHDLPSLDLGAAQHSWALTGGAFAGEDHSSKLRASR